jgi:peptidoglycan/LPS O-acetylase OafA/YrhL
VIGICIALAIILAYLFWPTKTKPIIKPEVSKEQIWFKLKRKWEELSKKRYEYKGS